MQDEIQKRIELLEQRVSGLEQKFLMSPQIEPSLLGKKRLSIKEFLITKDISDDVKRTLAVAYFLEHEEKLGSVNTDDLKKAFQLAKSPLPTNINDKVNINIRNGHMMEAAEKKESKKAWVLTATGESFVEDELKK